MLPVFNVLSDEDVLRIEDASLTVLEKTGIFLEHPKAQEILSGLGAKISDDKKKVFLPRALVKEMTKKIPSSFTCAGRDPNFDLEYKPGNFFMRQAGGPISLFDMRTNTATPLTFQDCMDSAILVNSLPNIDVASAMTPQDINPATYDIAVVKGLLENCHKHFWGLSTHATHVEYQLKMAEVVAGGLDALRKRPLISGIFCVIEPLRYPSDEIDRLMLYGHYGIPLRCPMSSLVGANAPYTMAGTMTQLNAEFLGAATIFQALCPGLNSIVYPFVQLLNMRNGLSIFNGPETLLVYGAMAQMARHYQAPSGYCSGVMTDTQSHQFMFHCGTTILMSILNQITEQNGAGSIEGSFHFSHQSMVIVDELMGNLKTLSTGIDVNDDTLAVDDIHKCADKGEYVSSKLTLKYLRKEKHYAPDIMDFRVLSSWNEKPDTIIDRAEAKVQKILKEAEVKALPSDQQKELDDLMKAAEKEFA